MAKAQNFVEGRHGNVYIKNRTPRKAIRQLVKKVGGRKPDFATINEGGRSGGIVSKLSGYRVHKAQYGPPKGRNDVMILVRRRHRYLGEMAIEVASGIKGIKAAHNRNVIVAMFRVKGFGKCAVIAVHPSPGPIILRNARSNHKIARQYQSHVNTVEDLAKMLRGQGYRVFFSGDIQLPPTANVSWSFYKMFDRAKLKASISQNIDVQAGDEDLQANGSVLAPAGRGTGADHPFLRTIWRKK